MTADCDVAIVGAGPAGAATARRLAQRGCRVVLLERSRFDAPRIGESLAPGVQPLLSDLGVWLRFLELRPLPSYGTRSAWGAAVAEEHSHLLTPYLNGWHIDRQAFDRMLADSAVQAGAQLRLGVRAVGCAPAAHGGSVLVVASVGDSNDIHELSADFVIDASGRGAALARCFGARHAVFDRLVGIGAQFEDARAGSHCYTLVETTPAGWWYSAPVSQTRSVAMLMTDGDLARAQGVASPPQWRLALRQAALTGPRIDGSPLRWGPRVFSAVSRRLMRGALNRGARWLAVGDAALGVDPVSGSGVIRALRTAQSAATAAVAALAGDTETIAGYEAARDEECTSYLVERAAYYGIEQRWPNAPFWSRRRAQAILPEA